MDVLAETPYQQTHSRQSRAANEVDLIPPLSAIDAMRYEIRTEVYPWKHEINTLLDKAGQLLAE